LGGAAAITRPDGARVAKLDGITPRCLLGYDGSSQARDGEVTAKEAAPPLPCAEAWFSMPIAATGVSRGEKARLANPTDVVRSTRVNKGVARVDCDRDFISQRYDRLADIIALFDWLFCIPPELRRRAVDCLTLRLGDCVLDVGCGSGRNFPFLRKAIGSTGRIYGVDLSARMLRKARELGDRHHWTNIHLTEDDAVNYVAPEPLDGVLFSFSRAAASLSSTPSFRAALEERSFCLSVCG